MPLTMDFPVHLQSAFFRKVVAVLLVFGAIGLGWPGPAKVHAEEEDNPPPINFGSVAVQRSPDGSFQYLVNGSPELFIGMGYNPIYRHLSDAERRDNYDRDFRRLCQAGVNHILGWDADRGYEQDKFDELTLDRADKAGLGVIMPVYLPPDGDYRNPTFVQSILDGAAEKVVRFKDHPALRMWGVGNEVLDGIPSPEKRTAFARFYVSLVDQLHSLDPAHPIIYRAAEDVFIPYIGEALRSNRQDRPWLHFGVNAYTPRLANILDYWPVMDPERPLFVTEFGADFSWYEGRAAGYLNLWRVIRAYRGHVLGGAAYAWTTAGPEPTDSTWGLTDELGQPVDETFEMLAAEWIHEHDEPRDCY